MAVKYDILGTTFLFAYLQKFEITTFEYKLSYCFQNAFTENTFSRFVKFCTFGVNVKVCRTVLDNK